MGNPLRVLIIEDSEDDTLLIVRELKRGGYEPAFERVELPEAMTAALATQQWDIIISDYRLPHFSGLLALKLLKDKGLDIPFILVSGIITEDEAIEAMEEGAQDYIMKDHLRRLLPAVTRELREAEIRRARWEAEKKLRASENLYRTIFETTGTAISIDNEDTTILLANKEYENITGYTREELEGKKSWTEFVSKEDVDRILNYHYQRRKDTDSAPKTYDFRLIDREGNVKYIYATVAIIPETKKSLASLLDITMLKEAEQALLKNEEELQRRVKELEDFYDMAVGRELRMIELKEEIENLREQLSKCRGKDLKGI